MAGGDPHEITPAIVVNIFENFRATGLRAAGFGRGAFPKSAVTIRNACKRRGVNFNALWRYRHLEANPRYWIVGLAGAGFGRCLLPGV